MASSLQKQLAAIAAKSTHQLDLKAQKARHGKSLLFEARDAATQSFDTIYQICYEGFEELCMLDSRFLAFGQNLFSEQSKDEDRTQLTARENEELNKIIESFLGLVCGRLLLKPAMKVVEWLVRRFRVQEYNTECILLTFLPYHTSHIFPTLLSILSDQLPPSFKFLHPYVASLQSPPRHAIVSAAISSPSFFTAFSQYVLNVAKARHHSAVLIGVWTAITVQAVNGMIDTSRSGRDSIRRQREEDLLLRVLPTLQSAVSIKGVPELYISSCMVMTILATKASAEDKVLDAMLQAIASGWTDETFGAGLSSLAVITEEKRQLSLPQSVLRFVLKSEDAFRPLIAASKSQRVGKLAASSIVAIVEHACRRQDTTHIHHATALLESEILPKQLALLALENLMSNLVELRCNHGPNDAFNPILGVLESFALTKENFSLVQEAAQNSKIDLKKLGLELSTLELSKGVDDDSTVPESAIMQIEPADPQSAFDASMQALPQLPDEPFSFLEPQHDRIFYEYASAFETALSFNRNVEQFLEQKLHISDAINHSEAFTFLARFWTSNMSSSTRASALHRTSKQLRQINTDSKLDCQVLLPYAITALADPSPRVRQAAAELCRTINSLYGRAAKKFQMCPETNIYGATTPRTHWLSSEDAYKLVESSIAPILQDSALDSSYIVRALVDILNHGAVGAQGNATGRKEMKKSLRADVCTFLALHAASTPVMRVKLVLLRILNRVGKSASHARAKLLLPFVKEWIGREAGEISSACAVERVAVSEVDKTVLGSLTHRSTDELHLLKDIAAGSPGVREELVPIAFDRLRHLFPIAASAQVELADFQLGLALATSEPKASQAVQDHALETLRSLFLPTEVLVHLVESLPSVSDLKDQPPSAKRQRTHKSESVQPRDVDRDKMQATLRHITLVLELVESSKAERHPQLLRGLFHVLGELHSFKHLTGSELVYIHQILLGCILAIVDNLTATSNADIDRSVIRTDLIVECVRNTSSVQIHNTALLLVSSLASWAPELVLHSVMPLFTHMSSTLLRQSDSFSTHVTDQAVARIVPPLAASLKKKGRDLITGVSELLLSFTAAYEHIPLHRRSGLFQHLVETIGPDEALFAVFARLIDRFPGDLSVCTFVAGLMDNFSASTAITASSQYLDLVFDALKPKRGLSETLLSLNDKDGEVEDSVGKPS